MPAWTDLYEANAPKNPITLFTGQWAGIKLEKMVKMAKAMGFDGLEAACWGEHFNVQKAIGQEGEAYLKEFLKPFAENKMGIWALGAHLVGQALTDKYATDPDLLALQPEHVKADDPEQVRKNAAKEIMDTAKATARLREVAKKEYGDTGVEMWSPHVVTAFTGSPLWHRAYPFPPYSDEEAVGGSYEEVSDRLQPILNTFRDNGVYFTLETHPTEQAFDGITAARLKRTVNRDEFGFNNDPSHLIYQGVDPDKYVLLLGALNALYHSHIKDSKAGGKGQGNGLGGVFGSFLAFGDPNRYWDFKSVGLGDVDIRSNISIMQLLEYPGPFSVEWEHSGLKKEIGAQASQLIVRGYRDGVQSLVEEGMALYRKPDSWEKPEAFDKAFAEKPK